MNGYSRWMDTVGRWISGWVVGWIDGWMEIWVGTWMEKQMIDTQIFGIYLNMAPYDYCSYSSHYFEIDPEMHYKYS